MFYECKSLSSLPDISKWNIDNATSMSCLFYGCSKLESLPDLSKWNPSKITDMNNLFNGLVKVKSLPDIGNWNTSKVIDMSSLFYEMKSSLHYQIFQNGIYILLMRSKICLLIVRI